MASNTENGVNNTNKHDNPETSVFALWRCIMSAAGQQAPLLYRCCILGVVTAALRGLAFATFIPFFLALADRQHGWLLVFWASMATLLLVVASVTESASREFDYGGHATRAMDELRRRLGQHLRRIPLEVLSGARSGELTAVVGGNVDDVVQYTGFIVMMMLGAVVTPTVTALCAMYYDWRLGLALLLLFPSIIPVYLYSASVLAKDKSHYQAVLKELEGETIEYMQGLPVLRSTGSVGDKAARFSKAVRAMQQVQRDAMNNEALPNMTVASAIELGMMAVAGLGLWCSSEEGEVRLLLLSALLVAMIRFSEPLSLFLGMMSVIELMRSGYKGIDTILAISPLPQLTPAQVPTQYNITFEKVSYCYMNNSNDNDNGTGMSTTRSTTTVLRDLSLEVPANAMTALVGASGCGKTTLTRLVMRYGDPTSGRVLIGGVDIRHIAPETLNSLIAVVFQDVYLFDDTIMANLRMGRPEATDAEIIAAAEAAQCHQFIQQLPHGYNTRVGDIGNNLSGGEKQRLSIARALLKDAPIIILDEPTAALDTHSECAVQAALDVLVRNKTVLVIAHRLSTIVGASKIAVLEDGTVAEEGTHQQLLEGTTTTGRSKGIYAKLWNLQQQQQFTL